MMLDYKAPQYYLVELDRGQRRWLHTNKLRPYHARVNAALVYHCAIVYDEDEDFGTLPGAAVCNDQALPSSRRRTHTSLLLALKLTCIVPSWKF